MDLNTPLDISQLENIIYCKQLYLTYLENTDHDGMPKYYYHYDTQLKTIYGSLMEDNLITVRAHSIEEAIIMCNVLELLFDGISNFCGDDLDGSLSVGHFFNLIEDYTELLTQSKDYCSVQPKKLQKNSYHIAFFNKPLIFDKDRIIKLLMDKTLEAVFDDDVMRVRYLLSKN